MDKNDVLIWSLDCWLYIRRKRIFSVMCTDLVWTRSVLFFDWIHPIQCSLIDQKGKKSGVHDFRHVALLKRLNWLNSGRHRLLTSSCCCIYLSLLKESSLLIRIYPHFEIDPSNLLLVLPFCLQKAGLKYCIANMVLWILTFYMYTYWWANISCPLLLPDDTITHWYPIHFCMMISLPIAAWWCPPPTHCSVMILLPLLYHDIPTLYPLLHEWHNDGSYS